MLRARRRGGVCAAVAISLASGASHAAERQTLDGGWPAGWNRIGPTEAAVIGTLGFGAIVLEFLVKPPATPRWEGPILFDEDARNALRAGSETGRSRAALASDFGYLGLPVYAIGVEAGLVTWLGKGQFDAALQLALINAEALAVNGVLTRVTQRAVARMRPDGTSDNTSFFSGHTSAAFTTASALCVQHSRLEIYGGIADKLVCPAAVAVAATTGLLRMIADRHWASDVMAGAAFGTLVGATVSWVHLGEPGSAPAATLSLGAGGRSLFYGGRF